MIVEMIVVRMVVMMVVMAMSQMRDERQTWKPKESQTPSTG